MINNAEDLIKLYISEPINTNNTINIMRREIAIMNSLIACDVVLMEQDHTISDYYLEGFIRHWNRIRVELLNELAKCREELKF